MIRNALPVAVWVFAATMGAADTPPVSRLSGDAAPKLDLGPCENTRDANNCARVLACLGDEGLWFDGRALGWNSGTLAGQRSDGVVCAGTWSYGGFLNTVRASMECQDGLNAQMIYTAQDSLTGTGIAHGMDSEGRRIKAWTGNNVLQFLGESQETDAALPCTSEAIPVG